MQQAPRSRPTTKKIALWGTTLLSLGLMQSVHAQNATIVNWGGDYITPSPNSQDLQGKNADTSGLTTGRNFSTTTPMNPISGYSGVSSTFYGGAATAFPSVVGSTPGFDLFEVQNQGLNDMLNFQITQGTQQHDMHYVQYWDKSNFLASTANVTFTNTSQFSITITNANSSMNNAVGYWLVREGSNFFLSQATFTPSSGTYTYNPYVSAVSDGSWAPYSPSGLNIDFNQGAATFTTQKFTDITGVGFYLEHDVHLDNFAWAIPGFSVSAAVPEPQSIIMLSSVVAGIGSYLGYRRVRFGKKQSQTK